VSTDAGQGLSAIMRRPGTGLANCQLAHQQRVPIDAALLQEQHRAYQRTLEDLGVTVTCLPPLEHHPDALYVEDCALVLDELAVITRPGTSSRRGEIESLASILSENRRLLHIEAPGTLEGGDILVDRKNIWVGLSQRSNQEGIAQLAAHLQPDRYTVARLRMQDCLHLKSAVTSLGQGRVLANRDWVDLAPLGDLEIIEVDATEPHGANVLSLANTLLCSASYPHTNDLLRNLGYQLQVVDLAEIHKMEASVTCLSLLFAG